MKKVYVCMAADVLHPGHLNIIREAKKLGRVIVGLLTDQAICQYKRQPLLNFDQRKEIVEALKDVDEIIPQETPDYRPNLRKLRPEIVIHGDDWKTGVLKDTRKQVINVLKEWNGQLIEPKHTKGISSSQLVKEITDKGVTSDNRLTSLKKLLNIKPLIKLIESHSGITGLIIEKNKNKYKR